MKRIQSLRFAGLMLIIILIIILFTGCSHDNSLFYNKILNDNDTNSYFVAIDIKCPSYKGLALIENNNLYLLLHKIKGLNKEEYKSFMRKKLVHHRTLRIRSKSFEILNFIKVNEQEKVIQFANQGEEVFIAHYFNGTMLKYGVPVMEQYAIINQLFYWEIPAKIDKISGELIIG